MEFKLINEIFYSSSSIWLFSQKFSRLLHQTFQILNIIFMICFVEELHQSLTHVRFHILHRVWKWLELDQFTSLPVIIQTLKDCHITMLFLFGIWFHISSSCHGNWGSSGEFCCIEKLSNMIFYQVKIIRSTHFEIRWLSSLHINCSSPNFLFSSLFYPRSLHQVWLMVEVGS